VLDVRIVKARAQLTVDVAFTLRSGETCGLFGISGAGKSTILSCIAGVEEPDRGSVDLGGVRLFPPPLPLEQRRIGYLTQEAHLFPHLNVARNVCFGVRGAAAEGWLAELRDRLELGPIWTQPVRAISGGQARRVALARMLARRPDVVLLDEPFAGLDRSLVRDLLAALAGWQQQLGFTLVVVDHDADILARATSRVLAIETGRIVQDTGWDALRAAPATPVLAALLAPL
jgi:ABC-type sulfate/molybdate transport systems ATPase subunit